MQANAFDVIQVMFNLCTAVFMIATAYGDRLTAKRLKELEEERRKCEQRACDRANNLSGRLG